MAEIINLRRARKRKVREARAERAEGQRIRFGRTKAQKERDDSRARRREQELDGKKLED